MEQMEQTSCLIASMPRSGTHWSGKFIDCYEQALANPDMDTFVPLLRPAEVFPLPNMGISRFLWAQHVYCPGFAELYHGRFRKKWNDLPDDPGFNLAHVNKSIAEHKEFFHPHLNEEVKIVFLFRNPLDQMVSFFEHTRNHFYLGHKKNENGQLKNMFQLWIKLYIKVFFSYDAMRSMFPHNILLVSYEKLKESPHEQWKKILVFYGHTVTHDREKPFHKSIENTSIPKLQELERRMGHTLGKDQTVSPQEGNSHMRGGEIGKWRHFYTKDMLREIEETLQRFNYSLTRFKTNSTALAIHNIEQLAQQLPN